MKTKKIILAALFAALVTVATMIIHIPSGLTGGYINMGDAMVLLSAYILGPIYGAMAAGIGSSIADILLGCTVYAPWTLIIKFLVALVAGTVYVKHSASTKNTVLLILCGVFGEILMVVGYFVVEFFLSKSIPAALVGIYGSIVQAVFGIAVSTFLYKVVTANKMLKNSIDKIKDCK